MEWGGESNKVRGKSQKISFSKVPQMDLCLQKESKWENTNKEYIKLYNRSEGRIYAKEKESISIVKREERRDV